MQRSKSLALSFLLGALLVGGALGFSAYPIFRADACRGTADRGRDKNKLFDNLHLSVAQRAATDSILERRHRDITTLFEPLEPQADSIRKRARQDMFKLLTPEQAKTFKVWIDESHRKDSATAASSK